MTHLRAFACTGALITTLLPCGRAGATTLSHCSFANVSTLALNGSADQAAQDLELTTAAVYLAGSAYDTTPIPWSSTSSFHTSFQFVLTSAGGAEGIAFILQGSGLTALGGNTGQMGYGDIATSVEVEFDTYKDAWDPNGNHVGIMENGAYKVHLASASPAFDMAGAGPLFAWIDFDAPTKTLSVYLSQASIKPVSPVTSAMVDVASALGATAYAGFTGATGGGPHTNEQVVVDWEFSTDGIPCACGGIGDCPSGTTCAGSTNVCSQAVLPSDAGSDAVAPDAAKDAAPEATPDAPTVTCETNASCDSTLDSKTPICGPSRTCGPCTSDSDCAAPLAPYCATTGAHEGQCVECETSLECPVDVDAGDDDGGGGDAETHFTVCVDNGVTNVCGVLDAGGGSSQTDGGGADATMDGGGSPTGDSEVAGDAGESFAGGACSCRSAGGGGSDPGFAITSLFAGLSGLLLGRRTRGRPREHGGRSFH